MTDTLVLNAESRTETGKQVRKLRLDGRVPAVLYGHNVKPTLLTLSRGQLERIYRKTGGSSVVKIQLKDDERNALIQEVQHDPKTGRYLHADLYQVRMDEKIKADVPLVFEGTAPAIRELEGTMLTNLAELEVECLPGDLPPDIKVDISSLGTFEDVLTVANVKVPAGVTILNDPETNVASVAPPRTQEELDELETEAELDVEAVEGMAEEAEEGEAEEGAEGKEAEGESGEKAGEGDDKGTTPSDSSVPVPARTDLPARPSRSDGSGRRPRRSGDEPARVGKGTDQKGGAPEGSQAKQSGKGAEMKGKSGDKNKGA